MSSDNTPTLPFPHYVGFTQELAVLKNNVYEEHWVHALALSPIVHFPATQDASQILQILLESGTINIIEKNINKIIN